MIDDVSRMEAAMATHTQTATAEGKRSSFLRRLSQRFYDARMESALRVVNQHRQIFDKATTQTKSS
jgi:hypothetical protein